MNINEIKEIIKMVTSSDITKFNYCESDTNILIERGKNEVQYISAPQFQVQQGTVSHEVETKTQVDSTPAGLEVKAPLVGIFYGKPSPTSDLFVKVGDTVKAGTVLCIIEAMKVMNEITADYDMKIIDALAEDSGLVEFGQTLFIVEKL